MDEDFDEYDEGPRYDDPEAIGSMALYLSLSKLVFSLAICISVPRRKA